MAQSGLHGLIGLAMAQMAGQEAEGFETRNGSFKWSFVLGSMLPDIDMYLVAIMTLYLKDPIAANNIYHRTWSHSMVTQSIFCLLAYFLWARRSPQRQGLVTGLWVGMLVHTATDLFLWFSPVDLLWPLGVLGLHTSFNAWVNLHASDLVANLLGSAEFLVIGLFFGYLARIARAVGADLNRVPSLRRAGWVMYLLALVATVLAFFLSKTTHMMLVFPVVGIVGLTLEWWFMWQMREAIAKAPAMLRQTDQDRAAGHAAEASASHD